MARNGFTLISGGQTGVDRAALDAALDSGMACGGWCPAGRMAEDGPVPARYPLRETPESDPVTRTARNVAESDGTLILLQGRPDRGTRAAIAAARRLGRPCLRVDLFDAAPDAACADVLAWIIQENVRILNIAGPRESSAPGIYARARAFLKTLFGALESRS